MGQPRPATFVVGLMVGLLAYECACRRGTCRSEWNQVCMHGTKYHIHHWILNVFAIFLLMFVPCVRDNHFLRGVVVGGIVHGLAYSDWHVVRKTCLP